MPGTTTGAAKKPRPWEWFWRSVAVLILLTIGWVAWVMYQIMPRSVVTPLAFESQVRSIAAQPPASAMSEVAATQQAARPAPERAAADLAMEQAQAAMRAGAHQASADVQAAALPTTEESGQSEKLKLSTEITTPLAEGQSPAK